MSEQDWQVRRFGHHRNAFGLLRLIFASAVIFSHAPILRDGTESREPFRVLFGAVTVGEVAVDAFFAISGFLISASLLSSRSTGQYLAKRIARIYPAAIVVSLVCLFVVAPLGGARLAAIPPLEWLQSAKRIVLLAVPVVDTFHGTAYPMVNGSMWTIIYEFRCYLLLVPLAWLGLLRRPWVLAGMAGVLVLVSGFAPQLFAPIDRLPLHSVWFGQAADGPRLYGIFLAGAAAYAFGDRLRFTGPRVMIATAITIAGWFSTTLATPLFAVFGVYAVLGTALLGGGTWMERINNRDDVSYGVYLYGWPITKLLTWFWPAIPLAVLLALNLALALLCGWVSWHVVEKPALRWLRGRSRGPSPVRPAVIVEPAPAND